MTLPNGRTLALNSKHFWSWFVPGLPLLFFLTLWVTTASQPILSSHYFRQTQTAQTTQIFLDEGFDLFHPKVRFFGKPGITALEFPIYQFLQGKLSETTGVPIQISGRILSGFSALLFVFFLARILSTLTLKPKKETLTPAILFGLFSPLALGISQWVSIEMMNCAFAAGSLSYFLSSLKRSRIADFILFFVLSCGSLLLKPTMIFGSLGLYGAALLFHLKLARSDKTALSRIVGSVFLSLIAGGIAGGWYHFANQLNTAAGNPFALSTNTGWYFLNLSTVTPALLLKLVGRIGLYLIGPGTLLALGFQWQQKKNASVVIHQYWYWGAVLGAALYLLVFLNLNFHHNYYQLPLLIPFSVAAGSFFMTQSSKTVVFPLSIFGLGLILNASVAQTQLSKADVSLAEAVRWLEMSVPKDWSGPEILAVANDESLNAVLGLYLGRYLISATPNDPAIVSLSQKYQTVALCNVKEAPDCTELIQKTLPQCSKTSQVFGNFWACSSL